MATWACDVKISQPPGETGGYLMPSFINTGKTQERTNGAARLDRIFL